MADNGEAAALEGQELNNNPRPFPKIAKCHREFSTDTIGMNNEDVPADLWFQQFCDFWESNKATAAVTICLFTEIDIGG